MTQIQFGIDRLLADPALRRPLAGRRVTLLAHPASVTPALTHSLDALAALPDVTLSAAFGPQHGLRGDKQDNMVESPDYTDPLLGIPVFSLYGEVRRPTDAMMDTFDVLLVDLQDLGCRIYTFITTLRAPLAGRRAALLAHPASVTRDLTHSLDALAALPDVKLSAAPRTPGPAPASPRHQSRRPAAHPSGRAAGPCT